MRKIHVVGLALVAMLAFFAMSVSAEAATEWLVEKLELNAAIPSETEGELTLFTLEGGVVVSEVLCSGIFDGTIGPLAEDSITALLNLAMETIAAPLAGLALECQGILDTGGAFNCEVGAVGAVLVWAAHLPWKTNLELMASGEILDLLENSGAGLPGYSIECKTLIGFVAQDTCEGVTSTLMTNDLTTTPASVDGEFNAGSEEGECKTSKLAAGAIGLGNTWGATATDLASRLETAVNS